MFESWSFASKLSGDVMLKLGLISLEAHNTKWGSATGERVASRCRGDVRATDIYLVIGGPEDEAANGSAAGEEGVAFSVGVTVGRASTGDTTCGARVTGTETNDIMMVKCIKESCNV